MTAPSSPAKRLLLLPLVLIALIVTGSEWLVRSAPLDPSGPATATLDLPAPQAAVQACRRGGPDDTDVGDAIVAAPRIDERVTSAAIIECPAAYDGKRVRYIGEAIGDIQQRRGGAWLLVNDDAYALEVGPMSSAREGRGLNEGLNVWVPDGQHDQIQITGNARAHGDIVEVVGEVHRTDPADGGGLTLRAQGVTVLARGARFSPPVHRAQAVTAAVLVGLTGLALWWRRQARDG